MKISGKIYARKQGNVIRLAFGWQDAARSDRHWEPEDVMRILLGTDLAAEAQNRPSARIYHFPLASRPDPEPSISEAYA